MLRTEMRITCSQTWNSLAIPGVTFFRYSATSAFSLTSGFSFLLAAAGLLDVISASVTEEADNTLVADYLQKVSPGTARKLQVFI